MRRRLGAMVLAFEAITALLAIPVAAQSEHRTGVTALAAIAILCVVAAGMLRRTFGIAVGWGMQGLYVVTSFALPAFAFVALPFAALWWYCMHIGTRIDRDRENS